MASLAAARRPSSHRSDSPPRGFGMHGCQIGGNGAIRVGRSPKALQLRMIDVAARPPINTACASSASRQSATRPFESSTSGAASRVAYRDYAGGGTPPTRRHLACESEWVEVPVTSGGVAVKITPVLAELGNKLFIRHG